MRAIKAKKKNTEAAFLRTDSQNLRVGLGVRTILRIEIDGLGAEGRGHFHLWEVNVAH